MFYLTPYSRKNSQVQKNNDIWDMRRVFEDFFNDSFFPQTMDMVSPIRTDVKETDKEFVLEAELPGINKDDIKVNIENNVLTIGYETKEESENKNENYIRRERRQGSFMRSYNIDNIEQDNISANYENGVLKLYLPKKVAKSPSTRSIDIN